MFEIKTVPKKFSPGNPMREDMFSMGQLVGNNLMVLYGTHDRVKHFEVVDTDTGDTIVVDIIDTQKEDHEFECLHCGTLIIVPDGELTEDVACAHCGTDFRYDYDNFMICPR